MLLARELSQYCRFIAMIIALSLLFYGLSGCATTKPRHQWTESALNAETAHAEGRLDEAESAYQRLLPDAPNADKRRWLQVNLGLLALERGDEELARTRWTEVHSEDRQDLHGANALYEVAKLADEADFVDVRLDVIRRYPGQIAAEFALQDIVNRLRAAEQHTELEQLLVELLDDVAGSELGDNVWFEIAQVRNNGLGAPNEALEAYRELFARYEKGPLADDALWEMSEIYRAHQQWEPAIQLMTKLANEVEASWFVGSYDSDWVDDAIYDIGWVYLVFLGDYDNAVRWFDRYLDQFPDGLLNDDAAWHIVEARRLNGDEAGYQRAMQDFAENFPESRYVRQIDARMGAR